MSMFNDFEKELPQNPANYSPLSPLCFLERTAAVFPERTAVIHGNLKTNWSETLKRCIKLASALSKRGVGRGSTVSLMAPNVQKKSNSKKEAKIKKTMANNIKKYKKIIEKNFDYVGDNFTEEAKKMKYGEKEERPIYGEATAEQTKELAEEEINVVPLPWAPTKKTN